LLADNYSPVLL